MRKVVGSTSYSAALIYANPSHDLLTIVDAALQLHPLWNSTPANQALLRTSLMQLEQILQDAGSLFRVSLEDHCLVCRVDPTVEASASSAIANAEPTAADHLRLAWTAAYGVLPDSDKAYDQAVLAVESLVCPLVSPRNTRATLGTVIRDLRNQQDQWELAIADGSGQPASIENFIDTLDMLWKSQSRHAGSPGSRTQSRIEGEAAVHLAVMIVQWLTIGVLRRK